MEAHARAGLRRRTLRLEDDPSTRALAVYAFAAEMSVSVVAAGSDMELEVENTGDTAFSFTAALHTYLKVREVEALRIGACAASTTGTPPTAAR